jgi:membrane protease YdiL (CAAX protease family)
MLPVLFVVLVAMSIWVHRGPSRAHLVTGPLAAAALVLLARLDGMTWEQLGLARQDLLRGAAYGATGAVAVAVVYAVGVAVPFTRGAFRDTRYRVGPGAAVFLAVVTIPLGTVLFEEVAFRGVLWGELATVRGAARATAVSAGLFGLWHVLPALTLARTSTAIRGGRAPRRVRVLLTVLGAVVFTAVAGVVLAELRRRSGSLVAPAVLHWAANGLGVLAAARVWAAQPATDSGDAGDSGDSGEEEANSCSR